ncbi:putative sulfate-binding protein [hydrothermal vent metagenome]|uniref:Putative sulfate-binding protein n=1 Tax=hydrothermal vent metagenome TaxID=652676 RepID=A0A3B0VFJ3_9ZZZZ
MISTRNSKAVDFSVASVDVVCDLHGNPCNPDLTLFFNGNQWMVVEELLTAFRRLYPEIQHIFYETLPPGLLAEQIKQGALRMEELIINTPPDVYTAGREEMEDMLREGFIQSYKPYARNGLAILVPAADPADVRGLKDLGRPGVRVSMPNPSHEGVGRLIVKALEKAGGPELVKQVMEEKVASGETYLTRIHHRETINLLRDGLVDAGPVWLSEALYQQKHGKTFDYVTIPAEHDVIGRYFIAHVDKTSRHPDAARKFIDFMTSESVRKIYAGYGFLSGM